MIKTDRTINISIHDTLVSPTACPEGQTWGNCAGCARSCYNAHSSTGCSEDCSDGGACRCPDGQVGCHGNNNTQAHLGNPDTAL